MGDYAWEIVDDGTMDTVIRVTLTRNSDIGKDGEVHAVRFDSESVRMTDGSIDEDSMAFELDRWADHIAESRI